MSAVVQLSTPGDHLNWGSVKIDIPFLQFADTYNAIEIFKVQYDASNIATDPVTSFLSSNNYGGTPYATYSGIQAMKDSHTILYHGYNTTNDSELLDVTDDVGNGILFPNAALYFNAGNVGANNSQSVMVRIWYRLRKVSDKDLIGMINQFIV